MLLEARLSNPARFLDQERLDRLARMLARVFDQDPHFNWMVRQDGSREEALYRLFLLLVEALPGEEGMVQVADDEKAVAIWYPPGSGPLSLWRKLAFLGAYLPICGWKAFPSRALGLQMMESRRPSCPHYYLQVIGVAERNRGHGRKLVEPMLEQCNVRQVSAYLETSNARNLGFYEKMGFRQAGSYSLPSGPRLWRLLHSPVANAVGLG